MSTGGKSSRRAFLKRIAAFASAAEAASLFAPSGNSAEVKASQSMVHYQNNPNQGKKCGRSKSFIPAGKESGLTGHGGTASTHTSRKTNKTHDYVTATT